MTLEKFILAVDQGTTGCTAVVLNTEGRLLGHADLDFQQIYPQPGWVEHDPEVIWQTAETVMEKALAAARVSPRGVAAIGITNQRETVVAWDATTGRALANAIVWQDRRTADRCEKLSKDKAKATKIRQKTGLVVDAYFSATKMEWLLKNNPSVATAAKEGVLRLGTVDSWLAWKLSNGAAHVTDTTNASRTMLFNTEKMRWDADLLKLFHVPESALPKVVDSSGLLAEADEKVFGTRVPISGIAGDQQAALFGQACFAPGQVKNTFGTGSFLVMNTGTKRPTSKRLLSTVAWTLNGKTEYALEGSVFTTGAALQWLRDGLGIISTAAETEQLAASVQDTGDVAFVPALAGMGAPYWDPYARGMLIGITRGTTRAHVVRAVLESIAMRAADVTRAMVEDSKVKIRVVRVDGGGSQNAFSMQHLADVTGVPVERPTLTETTVLGAAYLAGLGVGFWQSREEIAERWKLDARFEPKMDKKARDARYARWQDAVKRASGWARPR